jgi:RNase P/RNase MRP subunit POP5
MRRKIRYILAKTSSDMNIEDKANAMSLQDSLLKLMGFEKYADANMRFMNPSENKFIIRVNRGCEKDVVLALSFIKSINKIHTGILTLRISGSIKGLSKK